MFESERKPGALSVAMSAELGNVDRTCALAKEMLAQVGLSEAAFPVQLGLREALTNAVLHGSGSDAAKRVFCFIRTGGGNVEVEVRDEGPGFDWKAAPLEPPSPDAVGGRGLAIMRRYFARVSFNQAGNSVVLAEPRQKGALMNEIRRDGDSAVVRPAGDVTALAAEALRKDLKDLVDGGVKDLTVDLAGVEIVDSIGMGLLVAAHNSLLKRGGRLRVAGACPDVGDLLRTMRLDRHFEIETCQ